MKALKLVHPDPRLAPNAPSVEVDIRLKGALLSALFEVRSSVEPFVNRALPVGESQWGLWDWDVVELFVSCSGSASRLPYHEFQVSPLGQHLELEILEPRKQVNREFRCRGFSCAASRVPQTEGSPFGWRAEMHVPLGQLGWNGDIRSVQGGAFAILGPKEARTYWSLLLDRQEKPDFHLPQKFGPLL